MLNLLTFVLRQFRRLSFSAVHFLILVSPCALSQVGAAASAAAVSFRSLLTRDNRYGRGKRGRRDDPDAGVVTRRWPAHSADARHVVGDRRCVLGH